MIILVASPLETALQCCIDACTNPFAMPSTIYYDLDSSSKGAQKLQINL